MLNRFKLTLVTSGYVPNMTGGIASFISDMAPALAHRGHEVRVISISARASGGPRRSAQARSRSWIAFVFAEVNA